MQTPTHENPVFASKPGTASPQTRFRFSLRTLMIAALLLGPAAGLLGILFFEHPRKTSYEVTILPAGDSLQVELSPEIAGIDEPPVERTKLIERTKTSEFVAFMLDDEVLSQHLGSDAFAGITLRPFGGSAIMLRFDKPVVARVDGEARSPYEERLLRQNLSSRIERQAISFFKASLAEPPER